MLVNISIGKKSVKTSFGRVPEKLVQTMESEIFSFNVPSLNKVLKYISTDQIYIYVCVCVYIYVYTYICMHMYIIYNIYIH